MNKQLRESMVESIALIEETKRMLQEIENDITEIMQEEKASAAKRDDYFQRMEDFIAKPVSGNLFAHEKKRAKFSYELLNAAFEEITEEVKLETSGIELASSKKVYHKFSDKIIRHCYFKFEEVGNNEYLLIKKMTFDFLHEMILKDLLD